MLRSNSRGLNNLGNPYSESWRKRKGCGREDFAEREGFKPRVKE